MVTDEATKERRGGELADLRRILGDHRHPWLQQVCERDVVKAPATAAVSWSVPTLTQASFAATP